MKVSIEDAIVRAYGQYRVSIGKPSTGSATFKNSVTFQHFRAGILAGLEGSILQDETELKPSIFKDINSSHREQYWEAEDAL